MCCLSFLFDAAAIAETYTLSLHDALPIYLCDRRPAVDVREERSRQLVAEADPGHVGSRILQSALRINVGELVAEVAAEPRRECVIDNRARKVRVGIVHIRLLAIGTNDAVAYADVDGI